MTKVAYLAAEPDILAARKRLNEASEILKSADISRGLSDAALDDLQKKADLFAAEAYEKVALVRAAAAANIIKRIRPALDLANGVAPEAVQALPPPDPKIGG